MTSAEPSVDALPAAPEPPITVSLPEVPLLGENRILAKHGLSILEQTERPGLLALMDVSGIDRANGLEFGLAAYAFTNSTKTAAAVADALDSGMVGVNHLGISVPESPFGGIKESGYGHEGGIEGLDAYLISKFVTTMGV